MPIKLLIVEDSKHIRKSLAAVLECIPGVDSVWTASCLADALNCTRKSLPSMVVLDLDLADGQGLELIEPFKHHAPDVKIAVLTNKIHEFNKRRCAAAGVRWFFDKSIEFDDFVRVVIAQAVNH